MVRIVCIHRISESFSIALDARRRFTYVGKTNSIILRYPIFNPAIPPYSWLSFFPHIPPDSILFGFIFVLSRVDRRLDAAKPARVWKQEKSRRWRSGWQPPALVRNRVPTYYNSIDCIARNSRSTESDSATQYYKTFYTSGYDMAFVLCDFYYVFLFDTSSRKGFQFSWIL